MFHLRSVNEQPSVNEFLEVLRERIDSLYNSRNKFCKSSGFDRADLSKFLAGDRSWSINKVFKLLIYLNAVGEIEFTVQDVYKFDFR